MAWMAAIPMLMQMFQQQGGQEGGQPNGTPMPRFGSGAGAGGAGGGAGWGSMMSSLPTPGQRAGGIASGLFNLFGAQDPSKAANKYLEGIEGGASKYMDPYLNAGKSSLPILQEQFGKLLNDPTSVMSMVGNQYHQSPGYQFQVDQAEGAANRASASGGMLGSPQQQQQIAQTVNGIANQDYNGFLDRGLNLYGQGLQGQQGMAQMGFGAASQMVQALIQQYMAQAENAFAGAANSNSSKGGAIGSIVGGLF